MGIRSIISLGLMVIPIGATIGLLLGLDAQRRATGQEPLFVDNSVSHLTYCEKFYGISVPTYGQGYTLNPNQWAWNPGEPGHLCMKVDQWNNMTYPTPSTAPKFDVTWSYPPASSTQPVHAFPNIALDSEGTIFPVRVEDLRHLKVHLEWNYGMGKKPVDVTDVGDLEANGVNANVAIDMFLDSDSSSSQSTTASRYEIMVWFARIGDATDPLGYPKVVSSYSINGTLFKLYYGINGQKQDVMTWVADEPTTSFVGDIADLVRIIPTMTDLGQAPRNIDFLGYMGLGSETYYSEQEVTFSVPQFALQVS